MSQNVFYVTNIQGSWVHNAWVVILIVATMNFVETFIRHRFLKVDKIHLKKKKAGSY